MLDRVGIDFLIFGGIDVDFFEFESTDIDFVGCGSRSTVARYWAVCIFNFVLIDYATAEAGFLQ